MTIRPQDQLWETYDGEQSKIKMSQTFKQKDHNEISQTLYYQEIMKGEIDYYYIAQLKDCIYILFKKHSYQENLYLFDIQSGRSIRCDFLNQAKVINSYTFKNFIYILTTKHIFQIIILDSQIHILNKIKNSHSLNKIIYQQSDLIIGQQQGCLKIFRHNLSMKQKLLSKITFDNQSQNNCLFIYDPQKGTLIYNQPLFGGQTSINLMDINNKQIIITWSIPFKNLNLKISNIMMLQQSDKFLLQILGHGLFLLGINYNSRQIDFIKFLYSDIYQFQAFINNNLLSLYTDAFCLLFDKDYNISQKSILNFSEFTNSLVQNKKGNDLLFIKPQLLIRKKQFKGNLHISLTFYQATNRIFQSQVQNQKYLFPSEINNYQLEYYTNNPDTKQYKLFYYLSSNQNYLAVGYGYSLVLYSIKEKQEKQYFFKHPLSLLTFSSNSQYLYIIQDTDILCYKPLLDLKRSYQQFAKSIIQLSTSQRGIIIKLDQEGFVRVFNKQTKKLIFKLYLTQSRFFDASQNGMIMVSNNQEISLYSLVDRQIIIQQEICNLQCKLIEDQKQFLILTEEGYIQLYCFKSGYSQFKRTIMVNQTIILQGYSNKYFLGSKNQISILDSNLKIIKQVKTKSSYQDSDFDNTQIIQQNYIIEKFKSHSSVVISLKYVLNE